MLVFYKMVWSPAFHQAGESSHSWNSLDCIDSKSWTSLVHLCGPSEMWSLRKGKKSVLVNLFQIHVKIPHWWPADFGIYIFLLLCIYMVGSYWDILYADCKLQILQVYIFISDILLFLTALLETPTKDKLGAHLVLILRVHQQYVCTLQEIMAIIFFLSSL